VKARTVKDLCHEHEISEATYYLREIEEENHRLKQMYADLSLETRVKDVIAKKL
jgi:putative transposase